MNHRAVLNNNTESSYIRWNQGGETKVNFWDFIRNDFFYVAFSRRYLKYSAKQILSTAVEKSVPQGVKDILLYVLCRIYNEKIMQEAETGKPESRGA